ncbi:anti-sigma factor family protein [Porticoccus sp.]
MLSCREVVINADQLLDGELSWRRRLAVKVHLLICHNCRRYLRQLQRLIVAIPHMHRRASDEEVSKVMSCIHSQGKSNS